MISVLAFLHLLDIIRMHFGRTNPIRETHAPIAIRQNKAVHRRPGLTKRSQREKPRNVNACRFFPKPSAIARHRRDERARRATITA
jgi:hypothetical protein